MKQNIIGFIFARKNSKRLPKKNILKLGRKLLIEHTIVASIKSNIFDKIIVSSDDEKIISLKKKYKDVFFDKRPKNLASDRAKNIDVIKYYFEKFDVINNFNFFSLMLPTCPFRTGDHLKKAYKIIKKSEDINTILSVTKSTLPAQFSLIKKKKIVVPLLKNSPLLSNNTRSQNQAITFFPNGGFWICNSKKFMKTKNFYKGRIKIFEMNNFESVDIDTHFDYEFAKYLFKKNLKFS